MMALILLLIGVAINGWLYTINRRHFKACMMKLRQEVRLSDRSIDAGLCRMFVQQMTNGELCINPKVGGQLAEVNRGLNDKKNKPIRPNPRVSEIFDDNWDA